MPAIVHREVYAGEDATLTLYARDRDNAPLSLTGYTVTWRVGRPPHCIDMTSAVFSKSGTITDSANGVFTVTVGPSDTQYMRGDYVHEAWALTGSSVQVVTEGRLRVKRSVGT